MKGRELDQAAVVIGAGPAGLMAAEELATAGCQVDLFEAMPSVGRKFLRAGVGGLNLTHGENFEDFCQRYTGTVSVRPWLMRLTPQQLQQWAQVLGSETFVGTSGRVFPVHKKASPLLRSWLGRLHRQGVRVHTRHRWHSWATQPGGHQLVFTSQGQMVTVNAAVVVLALGGASWARLGSDGQWSQLLQTAGVVLNGFQPSNCGFDYPWSELMRQRFAGVPLKAVALGVANGQAIVWRTGEAMVSASGIQGSVVYQMSQSIRAQIEQHGFTRVHWDLAPDRTLEQVVQILLKPRGKQTLANVLRKRLAFTGIKTALLHELASPVPDEPRALATLIKSLPQHLHSARPLDEAISTEGGIVGAELEDTLMLRRFPGMFCAGEMLDWDAPTGGYLLNACFASGRVAGQGAVAYLAGLGQHR